METKLNRNTTLRWRLLLTSWWRLLRWTWIGSKSTQKKNLHMKTEPIATLLRCTKVIWTQSSFFLITAEEWYVFCGYQQLRRWKDIIFLWSYFQWLPHEHLALWNWFVTLIMKSQNGELFSLKLLSVLNKCLYRGKHG